MTGKLVLVATPIGNLGDITIRAVETLRSADVIACEDTRHTRKLLNHLDIRDVPTISVHQHNETERTAEIIERIRLGETVALVTDAGMPGISDPGERVVAGLVDAGLTVSVAPGPTAVATALAVSGLPAERFCFEGFLPTKGTERTRRLKVISSETRTSVLFEAPHRLARTVSDLMRHCGDERKVALVRELTKIHEEVWRGALSGLAERLSIAGVKGECVLVVQGSTGAHVDDASILEALEHEQRSAVSRKDAISAVAISLGVSRNRVYALATENHHLG